MPSFNILLFSYLFINWSSTVLRVDCKLELNGTGQLLNVTQNDSDVRKVNITLHTLHSVTIIPKIPLDLTKNFSDIDVSNNNKIATTSATEVVSPPTTNKLVEHLRTISQISPSSNKLETTTVRPTNDTATNYNSTFQFSEFNSTTTSKFAVEIHNVSDNRFSEDVRRDNVEKSELLETVSPFLAASTVKTTTQSSTIDHKLVDTTITLPVTTPRESPPPKPAKSRGGKPSLIQRLKLNSRTLSPQAAEQLTTPPEITYEEYEPVFDIGDIPKVITTTLMSMPSFYDATPPAWLLQQMAATTTTEKSRKIFEITVPPLDVGDDGSNDDGESGQLVDSSDKNHPGGIPVEATNSIIISAIIGGCAIVFFSVLMALCLWRQHKSRRPIYPPSCPMAPTTSMTSINSQKSVGLFQR